MLLLKPHDQPVGRGRKKTQGRFDPKKIFFWNFFEKKFWNFWKNLGFAILFWNFAICTNEMNSFMLMFRTDVFSTTRTSISSAHFFAFFTDVTTARTFLDRITILFYMELCGENFLFERLYLFRENKTKKSRQNKFPSWPQSKVTYWRVWRGWSNAGPLNFNMMLWNWRRKPLF